MCSFIFQYLAFVYLFVKGPRSGDNEVTFSVFESSCHLLLRVKPLKGRGKPLSALPKGITSKLLGLFSISILSFTS